MVEIYKTEILPDGREKVYKRYVITRADGTTYKKNTSYIRSNRGIGRPKLEGDTVELRKAIISGITKIDEKQLKAVKMLIDTFVGANE